MVKNLRPSIVTFAEGQSAEPFRLAMVQLGCPSYKRAMFEKLAQLRGVSLSLFVGDKSPAGHAPNGDLTGLDHVVLSNRILRLAGFQVVWQSVNRHLSPRDYDLIILPEGILYVSNYLLMLRAWVAGVPVAFYSHGYNHQRIRSLLGRLAERLRRVIHARAALIITYSQTGADFILHNNAAMTGRVFVALNTLDVHAIAKKAAQVDLGDLAALRASWGFEGGDVVLAFVGRVSAEKNPAYVICAVEQLRAEELPVRAIFVGDGPAEGSLRKALEQMPEDVRRSIKLLGRVPADDVGRYLRAADISVMPGMTGLAIVHSFAVGIPYVTIESPMHSPEIEYLLPNENGLITAAELPAFISGLRKLVQDAGVRTAMGASGKDFALRDLGVERQMAGFRAAIDYVSSVSQRGGRVMSDTGP